MKYEKPTAELIEFNEDIITSSGGGHGDMGRGHGGGGGCDHIPGHSNQKKPNHGN